MNDFSCKIIEPASGYFALSLGVCGVQDADSHKDGVAVFEISDPNSGSIRDFQVLIHKQDGTTVDIYDVTSVQISCTGLESSCGLPASLIELAKRIVKLQGENQFTNQF